MARTCLTIILAAGEGSRMKSAKPKVLHEVAGLSLVGHVMKAALAAGGEAYAVVVGNEAEMVAAETQKHASQVSTFLQTERLGTAHAVLAARQSIKKQYDDILILFGDTPMVNPQTLRRLRNGLAEGADIVVLGFKTNEPDGYGRLIEKDGQLLAIREHKDASPSELQINFCNGGNLAISGDRALELLDAVGNNNAKKEYYLTDVVEIARAKGLKVIAIEADQTETHGVNDRYELARIEEIWQQTTRAKMMRSGVTMQAPETVFLSHDTEIGLDAVIEPNVVFGPGVSIASGATVKAFSHIEGAKIGAGVVVGPFARLRPGTVLKTDSKVGNFCELKNAVVEEGAKVNHLSYIGDARVGVKANIGAGTITCNYDGANKFQTVIGAGSFIGSNSSLIAPIKIGDGAYIGSGSVITTDVPADALAIARGRQHVKEGYGKVIRDRNAAVKAAKSAKKSI